VMTLGGGQVVLGRCQVVLRGWMLKGHIGPPYGAIVGRQGSLAAHRVAVIRAARQTGETCRPSEPLVSVYRTVSRARNVRVHTRGIPQLDLTRVSRGWPRSAETRTQEAARAAGARWRKRGGSGIARALKIAA
jgi:hypothetical protein